MSMVHQFGKRLPRPVQVWVLDTVPGDVWCEAGDHPRDTIEHCRPRCALPVPTRKFLVDSLVGAGFTLEDAQWIPTSRRARKDVFPDAPDGAHVDVRPRGDRGDVQVLRATDLWPMLETPPAGLEVDSCAPSAAPSSGPTATSRA